MRRALPSLLAAILLAACGGTVDAPSGGGGAGGADAAQSASATGAGGGAPRVCGGRSGGTCGPAELCDYPDDSCGHFDSEGRCTARPGGCPEDCPGVCGCDRKFYCNACAAHQAGVDVLEGASCSAPWETELEIAD
ncbi:serine protease [Sorangium sp. So ce1036]|uniref:Kazal-type serine protease inhibitor family protein n=1 Tax=Sorangium sp. So ce1036 TaxID=3133328 RepID=UPI003EFF24AE